MKLVQGLFKVVAPGCGVLSDGLLAVFIAFTNSVLIFWTDTILDKASVPEKKKKNKKHCDSVVNTVLHLGKKNLNNLLENDIKVTTKNHYGT